MFCLQYTYIFPCWEKVPCMLCDVSLEVVTVKVSTKSSLLFDQLTWFKQGEHVKGMSRFLLGQKVTMLLTKLAFRIYNLSEHVQNFMEWRQPFPNTVQRIQLSLSYAEERRPQDNNSSFPRHFLDSGDIMFEIAEELDLASIQNLASAAALVALRGIATIRVRRLLQSYFSSPTEFAHCVCITGAVISGSSTLVILLGRSSWIPNDLDIVMSESYERALHTFLVKEQYSIADAPSPTESNPGEELPEETYPDIFEYVKYRNGAKVIDICVCKNKANLSILDFILWYHSTVVMNFISWDQICCMFPRATFNNVTYCNKFTFDPHRFQVALAKYEERGFSAATRLSKDEYRCLQDVVPTRWHGDIRVRANNIDRMWTQSLTLI